MTSGKRISGFSTLSLIRFHVLVADIHLAVKHIPPNAGQSGVDCSPVLFLKNECSVERTDDSGCAGNHVERIRRAVFSEMMHEQYRDFQTVSKLFEVADGLIVIGIARVPVAFRIIWKV